MRTADACAHTRTRREIDKRLVRENGVDENVFGAFGVFAVDAEPATGETDATSAARRETRHFSKQQFRVRRVSGRAWPR